MVETYPAERREVTRATHPSAEEGRAGDGGHLWHYVIAPTEHAFLDWRAAYLATHAPEEQEGSFYVSSWLDVHGMLKTNALHFVGEWWTHPDWPAIERMLGYKGLAALIPDYPKALPAPDVPRKPRKLTRAGRRRRRIAACQLLASLSREVLWSYWNSQDCAAPSPAKSYWTVRYDTACTALSEWEYPEELVDTV